MTKRKKKQKEQPKPQAVDLSNPDSLKGLDEDTFIGIISRLYEQNKQLSEVLQTLVKEQHGPKTERFQNPEQLNLFGNKSDPPAFEPEESEDTESTSSGAAKPKKNKQKGHGRSPMPAHVDREKVTGTIPSDDELMCKCCSKMRVKVNEILRNSRYNSKPATVYIEDFVELVFACPDCNDTLVVKPEVNESIKNGTAGPALQAEVAVAKYEDHMPLYRQEQRFARMGVPINRSTLCGWLNATSLALRPLYDRMHELLLLAKIIATDDTPVKVLDRNKKKNIKTGRQWIYRGDETQPFNVFNYTEGRGRNGPLIFLKGFCGYLLGDCFSGNIAICAETGSIFVACHVHNRRYYIKALTNYKEAQEILEMYNQLFEIERTARELELPADQVKLMREQEAKPILEKMKAWLDKHVVTALPKSLLGKAIKYSLNNWEYLNNYLLDGDIRMENNLAEQEMKRVSISKKNWYFHGSDNGGEQAEVLLSIISTCKRHGVNSIEYLTDVIQKLADNLDCDLDSLLPHNWKQNESAAETTGCHTTPKEVFA